MSTLQSEMNLFTWELWSLCKFPQMAESCLQPPECAVPAPLDSGSAGWGSGAAAPRCHCRALRGTEPRQALQALLLPSVLLHPYSHPHTKWHISPPPPPTWRLEIRSCKCLTVLLWIFLLFNYGFAELVYFLALELPLQFCLTFQNVSLCSSKFFLCFSSV